MDEIDENWSNQEIKTPGNQLQAIMQLFESKKREIIEIMLALPGDADTFETVNQIEALIGFGNISLQTLLVGGCGIIKWDPKKESITFETEEDFFNHWKLIPNNYKRVAINNSSNLFMLSLVETHQAQRITHLTIENWTPHEKDAEAITHFSGLQYFTCDNSHGNNMNGNLMKAVTKSKKIKGASIQIHNWDREEIISTFDGCNALEYININGSSTGDAMFEGSGRSVEEIKFTFNLQENNLDLQPICSPELHTVHLYNLDLENNHLEPLMGCTFIRHLDLRGNIYLSDGLEVLLKKLPHLETLNVSSTNITYNGLEQLYRQLPTVEIKHEHIRDFESWRFRMPN